MRCELVPAALWEFVINRPFIGWSLGMLL